MIAAAHLSEFISHPLLIVLVGASLIMFALTINAFFLIWVERKLSARIQRRLGPMEWGWHGTLQTFWDMLKLISKQLVTPRLVDKPLYHLAPVVVFAPVVATCALFPFMGSFSILDVDLGLILVFAFAGLGIIGIFMAGWGSNNKYALLGAIRSVAQNISYEIPLILSALAVVMMTGSASVPSTLSVPWTSIPKSPTPSLAWSNSRNTTVVPGAMVSVSPAGTVMSPVTLMVPYQVVLLTVPEMS